VLTRFRAWLRGRPADTSVGFTDHAADRLLERAAVRGDRPAARRELIRLHALEGEVRRRPPKWARLKPAPAYIVIGDWLCLPARPGRGRATWDATTLVCRQDATWETALTRGWITARPVNLRPARRTAAARRGFWGRLRGR
jgi:hypothetical protein